LLKSDDITDLIYEWLDDVNEVLHSNIENHKRNYENLDHFESLVHEELNLLLNESNKLAILNNTKLNEELEISSLISKLFDQNAESNNEDFWNIARLSSLSFIDQLWKNHLSEMDYLRSGIGLRAMGQRDPLVEYQKEGYDLFEELIDNVKFSVIRILLNFDKNLIVKKENNIDDKVKDKTIIKEKIGRNDPCPLGCGIKYKKCGIDKKCKKISETN